MKSKYELQRELQVAAERLREVNRAAQRAKAADQPEPSQNASQAPTAGLGPAGTFAQPKGGNVP